MPLAVPDGYYDLFQSSPSREAGRYLLVPAQLPPPAAVSILAQP